MEPEATGVFVTEDERKILVKKTKEPHIEAILDPSWVKGPAPTYVKLLAEKYGFDPKKETIAVSQSTGEIYRV
jgi:hypothetical protein